MPKHTSNQPNSQFNNKRFYAVMVLVPPSASTINVQAEKIDPNSLFTWYQSLIRLKRTNPAFAEGENVMRDSENNNVLSWMRKVAGAQTAVVAANFTASVQTDMENWDPTSKYSLCRSAIESLRSV
jgi:alpha-glucosidase